MASWRPKDQNKPREALLSKRSGTGKPRQSAERWKVDYSTVPLQSMNRATAVKRPVLTMLPSLSSDSGQAARCEEG